MPVVTCPVALLDQQRIHLNCFGSGWVNPLPGGYNGKRSVMLVLRCLSKVYCQQQYVIETPVVPLGLSTTTWCQL